MIKISFFDIDGTLLKMKQLHSEMVKMILKC